MRWLGLVAVPAALGVLLVPVGSASAEVLDDSASLSTALDTSGSGDLRQFDPALGTLTSVELTILSAVRLQACVENLSQAAGTTTGGPVRGALTVTFPGDENDTTASIDTAIPQTDLPASDGTDNCANGLAGSNYPAPVSAPDVVFFQDTNEDTTSQTITDAASFTPFVGTGRVAFGYSANSLGDIQQPSEWDIVFLARGDLTVTVRYVYTPTPGAPPPPAAPAAPRPAGTLPATGPVTGPLPWVAGLALLTGVIALAAARVRPRSG